MVKPTVSAIRPQSTRLSPVQIWDELDRVRCALYVICVALENAETDLAQRSAIEINGILEKLERISDNLLSILREAAEPRP
jgi:hypothetical protein